MKRLLVILLAVLLLLFQITACGTKDAALPERTGSDFSSASAVAEMPGPSSSPVSAHALMPDDQPPESEYDRAAWYGFIVSDAAKNPDDPVTEKEMADMLTAMISVYQSAVLGEWAALTAKASDSNLVYRDYGAMLILYAAELVGCTQFSIPFAFYSGNTEWDGEDMWGSAQREYPLFQTTWENRCESITKQRGPDEDLNYLYAALMYVISRYSQVSGMQLMEQNSEMDLRCDERMTYRESAVSVVRLYESDESVARLLPESLEALKTADAALEAAGDRRLRILESETGIVKGDVFIPGETYSGCAYYVSNNGSDENDGLTPQTAWATIDKVNKADLKEGDAVFFERGGTWRTAMITSRPGITYSAYGQGRKPKLYASPENGSGADKWKLYDQGEDSAKIWVYEKDMLDCGAVVLNEEQAAKKVMAFWNGAEFVVYIGRTVGGWEDGASERQMTSPKFDPKEQLLEDLTFFSEASSTLPGTLPVYLNGWSAETNYSLSAVGPLYLRCDAGNPGELYQSIEFLTPHSIFDGLAAGAVLDNLHVGYTGGTAICTGPENDGTVVQNCEVSWCGGAVASYSLDRQTGYMAGFQRLGGAVPGNSCGNAVRNNYIHEIYAEGTGLETFRRDTSEVRNITDNTFSGNLLYHCSTGLYLFNWDEEADPNHQFKNCVYEDNYVLYSGLCDWVDTDNYAPAFAMDGGPNMQDGTVVVRNNVFFAARTALIYMKTYASEYMPKFSGNQYIQLGGAPFLWHESSFYYASANAREGILNILGDETGKVTTLSRYHWENKDW